MIRELNIVKKKVTQIWPKASIPDNNTPTQNVFKSIAPSPNIDDPYIYNLDKGVRIHIAEDGDILELD